MITKILTAYILHVGEKYELVDNKRCFGDKKTLIISEKEEKHMANCWLYCCQFWSILLKLALKNKRTLYILGEPAA